ncbi:MAG: YciI family protein, partial [Gemmatimonadota bacterium]
MRYMSLWRPGKNANPPTEQLFAEMGQLIGEMSKAGILVSTGGWDPASPFFTVKMSNGKVTVTDGPYAEAKEVVAGFAIIEV